MTTAGQLDSLLAWVRLHGGQISSKLRFSGPDGSLGAFADETLDGGEIVVQVPKSICFSRATSSLSRLSPSPQCRTDAPPDLIPPLVLALHLCYELRLRHQSPFHPYLTCLPKQAPRLAGFMDQPKVDMLAGTEASARIRAGLEISADICARFFADHAPLLPHLPDSGRSNVQHFLHCYALVSSRSFLIDTSHGLALVPIADLFNHSDEPDVELASDPDADDLEPGAVELQVIGSGRGGCCGSWSEVFNTYGRLSNAHLLCRYGFILQGNSHDLLTLHTESEDPGSHRAPAGEPGWPERWPESELVCSPVKADHLAEANVEWDKKVYIDADGRLDFRSWLRLIDLAAQALALPIERPQLVAIWRLQQDVYNGQPAHGGRLGAVLQEVAGKLTHAVEARLKTYFRSEQPVDDLFELVSQDAIHDVLIGYIVGERVLLEHVRAKWSVLRAGL